MTDLDLPSMIPPSDDHSCSVRPVKKRIKRGEGIEAEKVSKRLRGFHIEHSEALKVINQQFTIGVTHNELKSIAQLICTLTGLKLDREASRDNRVLIKWFDENWTDIRPHVLGMHLRDVNQKIIGE